MERVTEDNVGWIKGATFNEPQFVYDFGTITSTNPDRSGQLVYTTDLGVYAVAGVSAVLLTLRNYLFYPIYSAVNLSLPVKTFYPTIIKGTVCSAIIFGFLFVTLFY